jgi:hypothetical protein
VLIRGVALLPLLPRLDVSPLWLEQAVDLEQPLRVPLGVRDGGFYRLVMLTPMQVLAEFATDPLGAIPIGAEPQALLRLMARLAPGTRIYYAIDRLAVRDDPKSTVARSAVGSFVLP